ncbi:MAG: hypothetical protein INR70_38780, partial [Parafilimonas terrae]|nr:hypothetical protein [Parafilimonas terrae]
TLRERAADLKAGLSRAIRQPEPQAVTPADPPAVTFTDQVRETGGTGDVLAASGIDHRDGTVSYADATGKVVRRPMSHWLGFNAQQMHGRVQAEISRRSISEANHLPDEERVAWDAEIRCELRSDAVHALAFRHVRAFEAAEAISAGVDAARRDGRDAELLALAPAWDAALDLYQRLSDEEIAVEATADERPGPSPKGAGEEWKAWSARVDDWRERTGIAAAEEASKDALGALGAIEDRIAVLPAASLAGLKLKARIGQRCDDIGVDWPDNLGAGLARDILAFVETAPVGRPDLTKPDALTAAILNGWKAWGATPYGTETDETWNRATEQRDQLLYAAMALPATPESVLAKALACAWMEWVDTERPGDPRDAYGPADQLVFDIHTAITTRGVASEEPAEAPSTDLPLTALVPTIDFASASMSELRAIREAADLVASVAGAATWQGCNRRPDHPSGAVEHNEAGKLLSWLSDAMGFVVNAAEHEARGREPGTEADQATRLAMLTQNTIENGEPAEIAQIARELLAHAAAERARG